jgi:hypothetical protein
MFKPMLDATFFFLGEILPICHLKSCLATLIKNNSTIDFTKILAIDVKVCHTLDVKGK